MPEARLSKPRYEDITTCKSQYMGECTPPVEQPLMSKCKELLDIAQSIEGSTEYLKDRLFGGKAPACNASGLVPYSIDDFLNVLHDTMESTYKTLTDLNTRT
jgi:hypothetical protein